MYHAGISEIAVLTALQDESAEAQRISGLAAGEDLFFSQPVAMDVPVAFANATVETVIFAVVGKFDQASNVDIA